MRNSSIVDGAGSCGSGGLVKGVDMVPVEKMQELGAVVRFWKSRIDGLAAELGMLQELRMLARPGGDRYAADRLLREIKKKSVELADTEQSLRQAQRGLGEALENAGHLAHVYAPMFDQGHAASQRR